MLSIHIKFNIEAYKKAIKENPALFFITQMEKVMEELQKGDIELPFEEIYKRNEVFHTEKYSNKWLYKRKTNRTIGLEALLYCELDPDHFRLRLQIIKLKKRFIMK